MPEYDPPVPPPPLPPPVSVAARFVSETTLEAAKQAREEAWKETYAKLGQEPPPKEEEAPYDGRSLWEKLQEHKVRIWVLGWRREALAGAELRWSSRRRVHCLDRIRSGVGSGR